MESIIRLSEFVNLIDSLQKLGNPMNYCELINILASK